MNDRAVFLWIEITTSHKFPLAGDDSPAEDPMVMNNEFNVFYF
jgi:hypothetical protein